MEKHSYHAVLGCLLYLARHSCPDICFDVSLLCRAAHDPALYHWTAAKRVLRYLRGTTGYGFRVGCVQNRDAHSIEEFCDAVWAGQKTERKSTTGYLIKVQGAYIA